MEKRKESERVENGWNRAIVRGSFGEVFFVLVLWVLEGGYLWPEGREKGGVFMEYEILSSGREGNYVRL